MTLLPLADTRQAEGPAASRAPADLAHAFDAIDNAVVVTGVDGCVLHVNAGLTRMFEFAAAEAQSRPLADLLSGLHTDAVQLAQLRAALAPKGSPTGRSFKGELLVYGKSGRPMWVSMVANPVLDAAAQFVQSVVVLTDITQTKMHEVLQHKVLEATLREEPLADVMAMLCREVERIAPEVVASVLAVDGEAKLRALAAPSLPPHVVEAIDGVPIGPSSGSCGTAAWRGEPVLAIDIATDPLWAGFRELVLPLGLVACWSMPITGVNGKVLGTFAFYYRESRVPSAFHRRLVEVSTHICALLLEREATRSRIHQLAYFDALTGLPNRALLQAGAERLLHEAERHAAPLAVLFIDLDRFKQVNDNHGRAAGDALLRETARRLRAELREGDVVGRLAGDEFAVVLPQCGALQAAMLAERLVAALSRPFAAPTSASFGNAGLTLHSGASIGVAIFPEDGAEADQLLRHAGMALDQAKTGSRGGFRFFSAEMNAAARERAMLESDLRHAIAHGGLELHYQPKVDAADTTLLRGVEALLRWQHPVLGNVPPLRFVALAEECGLIDALSRWVLVEACRQLAQWRVRGHAVPSVAVNLSPSNFQDRELPVFVAGTLSRHGLRPADLTLEITEGVMLDPDSAVLATIDAIHAQGVHLSLDDFGTGYSSLAHLHRLPIDELKLDRSFVRDLESSEAARALTTSVMRIAESLRMRVVAEGVETPGQARFLAERGCTLLQGYLYARPLPGDALAAWLGARSGAAA